MAAPQGDSDRLLRAMTDVLDDRRPASAAEALKMLRLGYPDIPLAMRIAALCARISSCKSCLTVLPTAAWLRPSASAARQPGQAP